MIYLCKKKLSNENFAQLVLFFIIFKENDYFDDFNGLTKSIKIKVNGVAKIHQLTKPIENLYW